MILNNCLVEKTKAAFTVTNTLLFYFFAILMKNIFKNLKHIKSEMGSKLP